jgi:hypothetical protein
MTMAIIQRVRRSGRALAVALAGVVAWLLRAGRTVIGDTGTSGFGNTLAEVGDLI